MSRFSRLGSAASRDGQLCDREPALLKPYRQ